MKWSAAEMEARRKRKESIRKKEESIRKSKESIRKLRRDRWNHMTTGEKIGTVVWTLVKLAAVIALVATVITIFTTKLWVVILVGIAFIKVLMSDDARGIHVHHHHHWWW